MFANVLQASLDFVWHPPHQPREKVIVHLFPSNYFFLNVGIIADKENSRLKLFMLIKS